MKNITVVTLSDGTVVNTFPGPVDGTLVARAFTELHEQARLIESDLLDDVLELCRELTTGPFEEGAQACFNAISEFKAARETIDA